MYPYFRAVLYQTEEIRLWLAGLYCLKRWDIFLVHFSALPKKTLQRCVSLLFVFVDLTLSEFASKQKQEVSRKEFSLWTFLLDLLFLWDFDLILGGRGGLFFRKEGAVVGEWFVRIGNLNSEGPFVSQRGDLWPTSPQGGRSSDDHKGACF